jgi:molecular chaperone DnaK (HSP70)
MLRMTTRAPRIDHIALSGGLCNMPKIPAMLQDHFPHATLNNQYQISFLPSIARASYVTSLAFPSINPEDVEAIGAAVQGSILCGPRTPFTWWEMTPAPFWNITVCSLFPLPSVAYGG